MIWIGLAIVLVTFWLIYKNYEARLVLVLSGVVMALIGQYVAGSSAGLSAAVNAFIKQLVNGGLVPTICTVMGFGYVMTFTKCSDHLVNALVRPLTKVPAIVNHHSHRVVHIVGGIIRASRRMDVHAASEIRIRTLDVNGKGLPTTVVPSDA